MEFTGARYPKLACVAAYLDTVPQALHGGIGIWGLWDGDSWLLDRGARQGAADCPLLFGGPVHGRHEAKPPAQGMI